MPSLITTHVLDTAVGRPASGVPVRLEVEAQGKWRELARGNTNVDGRVTDLLPADTQLEKAVYRITFELKDYFARAGRKSFYPYASIAFEIEDPKQHHHVPLLLSGFGFSTYRGS